MTELTTINIISFFLIFFIGLPHGSFDGAVASLVGYKSRLDFIKFLIYYIILFLIVIFFWFNFPIISLFIFLLITIVHFGLCDWSFYKIKNYRIPIILTHGMTVIFGIIYFNEEESFKIFQYLTNNNIYFFRDYIFIFYILTGLSIIYFIYLTLLEKNLRKGIFELLFLLAVFYVFNPLLSFTIYFCFFHTFKHLKHLLNNIYIHLPNKKFVLLSTFCFTLISWLGGIFIVLYLAQNFSYYESIIKVLFIGLAALTLPHMLLVDILYRKKF